MKPKVIKTEAEYKAGLHFPAEVALRATKAAPMRPAKPKAGNRRVQATGAR